MEELESKFEKLLIKTRNQKLIDSYSCLKLELNKVLNKSLKDQDLLIERIDELHKQTINKDDIVKSIKIHFDNKDISEGELMQNIIDLIKGAK